MRIDAHQHFWRFDPLKDDWITHEMQAIRRDFMPEDLKDLLVENKIDGCVAVQADQSEKENDFLLSLAECESWIKGVVGWVDLLSDNLSERLDYLSDHQAYKGVRHILQAESDGFMTSAAFVKGVAELEKYDLSYDILVNEQQLPEVLKFIDQLPTMRLVLNHIGKPDIKQKSFDSWAENMSRLSQYSHVYVKLSGLITEADWENWNITDIKPYVDFCLEHFGTDRLMYGSDWPVCLLGGSYSRVLETLKACLNQLSVSEQEAIYGMNASKFYQL